MEKILKEMICKMIMSGEVDVQISFPENIVELCESRCIALLCDIQSILKNDEYEDEDCFSKIEEIVCRFEEMDIDCGCRHDFG